jgi:hypothetical protein
MAQHHAQEAELFVTFNYTLLIVWDTHIRSSMSKLFEWMLQSIKMTQSDMR